MPGKNEPKTFGIDFGTSNSAVAVASGGEVEVVDWSIPESLFDTIGRKSSDTLPTVLFAPDYDKEIYIGHDAVAHYLFTGLEGRFLQSMKAFLPQSSFSGTTVRGRHYAIEDLVGAFLKRLMEAAEKKLGEKITGRIVLGRPARFSLDDEEDRLAEARLLRAAKAAGLEEVTLLIEPVAAALAYEAKLSRDETVFVADLGGGTSDFTLMRVGPSHRGRSDRRESILASGGIPVAGDCFDGEIVRARLFDAFGYGSSYIAFTEKTPVPSWIFHKLKRWNHVSLLKSKKYLDFLREVRETCDRRDQIGALIRLVDDDMGYLLFRAVERAKRAVHDSGEAEISDEDNGLPVRERMTRTEFKQATHSLIEDIQKIASSVLADAGVAPKDVDAVFMTGGTSLVPEIRSAFAALFGDHRLRHKSTFTSVVDGLARGFGQTWH
jgi:hypothetical chaperone protein